MERLTERKTSCWIKTKSGKDYTNYTQDWDAISKLASYEDTEDQKAKTEASKPDFPVLSNNDKRKEFLKGYCDWPIWFEVPEKDEVYYRYNLPDGSSIVICEYKTYLQWKEYYKEDPHSKRTELYLLKPGYHYLHDCEVSESVIVDHLRSMQKGLRK